MYKYRQLNYRKNETFATDLGRRSRKSPNQTPRAQSLVHSCMNHPRERTWGHYSPLKSLKMRSPTKLRKRRKNRTCHMDARRVEEHPQDNSHDEFVANLENTPPAQAATRPNRNGGEQSWVTGFREVTCTLNSLTISAYPINEALGDLSLRDNPTVQNTTPQPRPQPPTPRPQPPAPQPAGVRNRIQAPTLSNSPRNSRRDHMMNRNHPYSTRRHVDYRQRRRELTQEDRERRRRRWNASANQPNGNLPGINLYSAPNSWEAKCLIIGHSFITRLRRELKEQMRINKISWMEALNLQSHLITPHVHGIRGGQIEQLESFKNRIVSIRPDFIVVDIGTNDVARDVAISDLVEKLMVILRGWLHDYHFIRAIAWCHILHRKAIDPTRTNMSLVNYNDRATFFNLRMVRNTTLVRKLHHWRHAGFACPRSAEILDGVHPSEESGIWKHQKSISRLCKWTKLNI